MALSLLNCMGFQFCTDCPSVRSKAQFFTHHIPWVDVVLGIILCVIGGLASGGTIPIGAGIGGVLSHLGWLNIVVAIAISCYPRLKDFCRAAITKIPARYKPPCCQ
jgi:hypothetical protein